MRDWLAAAAAEFPERLALICPHIEPDTPSDSYTYGGLNQFAAQQALRLKRAGVQCGDRVGVLVPNGIFTTALIHAVARLGAVLVPLNARLIADELRYQVEAAACKLVVFDPSHDTTIQSMRSLQCAFYTTFSSPYSDAPLLPGETYLVEEAADRQIYLDGDLELDAVQSIVFTSGTTGKPKGAQITFGNLYHSALASAERLGASPDDRWFCPLPFYHVGGLSIYFRSCLYGSAVIVPEYSMTETFAQQMRVSEATLVSLVPTQLYRMLEAGFEPPKSLRLILLGGGAATPELVARYIERNLPIALTYGLTECASQVATATPDQVRAKPGTVGKPLSGTTVRIVDEQGRNLPEGEYGEIVVSGATVMRGYLGQAETNGTFHTGDIGYLDADGDIWIVQRRSDLIVSGGENVYPSEVEAVLRQHPAVEDACVVGIADAEWGQRVAAMVALRAGETVTEGDLIDFSRERLAGYKQPRKIVFVDELPQTASGKIQRRNVREWLMNNQKN